MNDADGPQSAPQRSSDEPFLVSRGLAALLDDVLAVIAFASPRNLGCCAICRWAH
jgi:hypothetical protein